MDAEIEEKYPDREWEDDRCLVCQCEGAKTQSCGRCKTARYCSTKCQKADWPVHKQLCKEWTEMPTRPSENHAKAFLFPENGKVKPIWLSCSQDGAEDLRSVLGRKHIDVASINANMILLRPLKDGPDEFAVYFRDSFFTDGSEKNQSVKQAVAPLGKPFNDWRGPMVALRWKDKYSSVPEYLDMDLSHFRLVLGYLAWYKHPVSATIPSYPRSQHEIRGVRLCCSGDVRMGFPKLSPVIVDSRLVAQLDPEVSSISRRVGPTLRLNKFDTTPAALEDPENQEATFLMLEADPHAASWGWAPAHWRHKVGTVLITREDGESLDLAHVVNMALFCMGDLQQAFESSLGLGEGRPMTKQEVLRRMTPQRLEECNARDKAIQEEYQANLKEMREMMASGMQFKSMRQMMASGEL